MGGSGGLAKIQNSDLHGGIHPCFCTCAVACQCPGNGREGTTRVGFCHVGVTEDK